MKYPTWWKGKIPQKHSLHQPSRHHEKNLHFRNITKKQKKTRRKQRYVPETRNRSFTGIDWGTSWAPELSYGHTSDLADSIMHATSGSHINSLWVEETPSYPVSPRVGHEYWIQCATPVSRGDLVTVSDSGEYVPAQYHGIYEGYYTWVALENVGPQPIQHKYSSVWDIVKDWVSDDGEVTAEDYYRRVTSHVLFRDVQFSYTIYPAVLFPGVDCLIPLNRWTWSPTRWNELLKGSISEYDDFFWSFRIHEHHLEFKLQHKTDRDGPCATCRQLMEMVPIEVATGEVGGILL